LFCNDKDTGLKAIIGIHNSVMGPALGGTNVYYANEWEALNDGAFRGMTFKAAITGLNIEEEKLLLWAMPKLRKHLN
jgi:leucine dehydrogenase